MQYISGIFGNAVVVNMNVVQQNKNRKNHEKRITDKMRYCMQGSL